jgi:hypothetical protein
MKESGDENEAARPAETAVRCRPRPDESLLFAAESEGAEGARVIFPARETPGRCGGCGPRIHASILRVLVWMRRHQLSDQSLT